MSMEKLPRHVLTTASGFPELVHCISMIENLDIKSHLFHLL